jgi:uncharacterized protein (TIGR02452 family)
MSQNRLIRSEIAQDTLTILSLGNYKNKNGKIVEIQDSLRYSVNNTELYIPKHSSQLLTKRDDLMNNLQIYKTEFEVTNETTLHCCNRQLANGLTNICCLNFASAKNPGGGFLGGSQAQEESLARASGLYASLIEQKSYYEANRNDKTSFYTDTIIYSPNVPVFRNDFDELIDEPYYISFITSPAVNVGALVQNSHADLDKIEEVMINRIEKILSVAIINGHDSLVLGAWGCGVFRNEPEDVVRYFAHHLKENPIFNNKFKKVSFAVLDYSANKSIFKAFEKVITMK